MFAKTIPLAIATILSTYGPAVAQDVLIGQQEYMNSCAQCHGPDGKGGGVMAGFLTETVPDLTVLQQNNGGVFPVTAVYGVIDGTTTSGVHGSRDMPAWGQRYELRADEQLGMDYTAADATALARGRILALIEYISTLQE